MSRDHIGWHSGAERIATVQAINIVFSRIAARSNKCCALVVSHFGTGRPNTTLNPTTQLSLWVACLSRWEREKQRVPNSYIQQIASGFRLHIGSTVKGCTCKWQKKRTEGPFIKGSFEAYYCYQLVVPRNSLSSNTLTRLKSQSTPY